MFVVDGTDSRVFRNISAFFISVGFFRVVAKVNGTTLYVSQTAHLKCGLELN